MSNVHDITERLPHNAKYFACMECGHDWAAVVPAEAMARDGREGDELLRWIEGCNGQVAT